MRNIEFHFFSKSHLSIFVLVFCSTIFTCCSKESITPITDPGNHEDFVKNIYVSALGNDSNTGTVNAPVKTIQKGLGLINPGDTVFVREGVYKEKISFNRSGNNNSYITLKAYPGEKATISGDGLSVNGDESLITLNAVSWITIEDLDICNFKTFNAWANVDGIVVKGASNHIIIRKNRVFNIENNATPEQGRSGHAIAIIGNTEIPITKVLVEGNEIFDCNTGYSENLTINGYVDGFEIRNNKVYNGENIGIVAAGGYSANSIPAYNYARNGIIADNEVFDMDGKKGPIPAYSEHNGAIGIYVDGARNIIVERNKVHDCGRGIGIVSETDHFPTQECIVRNNFVFNCSLAGISLGGYIGYTGGGTNQCYVINNTIYQNNRDLGYFDEVEGEIRLTENCSNNVIQNNIIYARPENNVCIHKYTSTGSNNQINYNLYYSTGTVRWIWNGTEYTNFDEWKSACDGDRSSMNEKNPLFVNTTIPDLHIQTLSPAKNAGMPFSTEINGQTDIDGQPRIVNNQISMGAQQ
ncbi:MAG: right-handed parallel beta-helix repeat-containing protein [Bacteroidales bacterium]|nr:right-handed parallel beta-helix repeat-containing protein [Bacteroidales bacterium]MDD4712057.1 right-handed parallel beta-helix repeat-containing protein [Bacteroidales bacterium]